MKNKKVLNIINLVGFLFLLYASFVFGKNGNGLNANQVTPIFMPASYAFGIWAIIYAAIFVWIIKGFLATPKESAMYKSVGLWFFITMILTGLSILVPVKVSPIFIIGALISSLITYYIIDKSCVSKLYKLPFSMLAGWLSVATIADISLVLKTLGVTSILGIGEIGWTVIMLVIGTIIAVLFTIIKNDFIYPLMFIWGYIAIMIENPCTPLVVRIAFAMIVIILVAIVYDLYTEKINHIE